MSTKYYHPDTDAFRKLDVPLPTAEQHGTEEDVAKSLTQMKALSWELQGNELIATTLTGRFAQKISTDYVLTGVDSNNLPVLTKIKL